MTPDDINLNFNQEGVFFLNFCIAFVMFGVALDLRLDDFRTVFKRPKPVIVGLSSQFLLLPALTFVLVYFANPYPSIGLGLLLVAACPGGNVSNFISQLAKGNVALSVSLTAMSTIIAIFMTPFNFTFWQGFLPLENKLTQAISLDVWSMIQSVVILIAIPTALGLFFNQSMPKITAKIKQPVKNISFGILMIFSLGGFVVFWDVVVNYIHFVLLIVLIHNALAYLGGYFFSKLFGLSEQDCRTVSIETGIQNAGLGLVLVFNFFDGLGGMALVCAWWGIWHFIAGTTLALLWARFDKLRGIKQAG